MIYMRIWEGLGNQLFQYAFIRALQLRNGEKVRLCAVPAHRNMARRYGLDDFSIKIPRSRIMEQVAGYLDHHEIFSDPFWGICEKLGLCTYMEEHDVNFREEMKYLKGTYFIKGYFQNENYFKDYEKVIRNDLRPRKRIQIPDKLKFIFGHENTVSVHIRRGDYKRYGNLLGAEYYKCAMKKMEDMAGDVFYVVFSDDISWVRRNMQFGEKVYFVDESSHLADYGQLVLMGRCRHNIIANSTFSWWGAWLNKNERKIVIGPRRWFVDRNANIMPDTWIKV